MKSRIVKLFGSCFSLRPLICKAHLVLPITLLGVVTASGQIITFAEFRNLSLVSGGQAPIETLQNRYLLSAAILRTRELVQSGRHLDFAVIMGIGLKGFESCSADEAEQEIRTTLGELPVSRLLFLPGPEDYGKSPRFDLYNYARFVNAASRVLTNKVIIDMTVTDSIQIQGFRLVALDSGFFQIEEKPIQNPIGAQLERIAQLIITSDSPVLLFSYSLDLHGESSRRSAWASSVELESRNRFAALMTNHVLCAVFGAAQNEEDWSLIGSPQEWSQNSDAMKRIGKSWIMPSVTTGKRNGFQIVSVSDDSIVSTVTVELPKLPATTESPFYPVVKLDEGDAYFAVEEFSKAADSYKDALSFTNAIIAAQAREKFNLALRKQKEQSDEPEWIVFGWVKKHLADVLLAGACVWALWYLFYFLRYLARGKPIVPSKWNVKISIEEGSKISADAFLEEFRWGLNDVQELHHFLGRNKIQLGDNVLIGAGLSLADAVGSQEFKVGGVDIVKAVGTFQKLVEYFSFKLDVKLIAVASAVQASATLAWAGRVERMWRVQSGTAAGSLPAREAGRMLAFEILSGDWVKQ